MQSIGVLGKDTFETETNVLMPLFSYKVVPPVVI